MGKVTSLVSMVALGGALAIGAPACGNDTGIVLEISMTPELATALDQSGEDFQELRVWVGHTTEDPRFFEASADAFFTVERTRASLAAPYRYLLEPTGALADIGPMVFAAAVGDDPDDSRLPFRISGFDVADAPMGFGDGQIRVVPLALAPPAGVQGGIEDGCIVWGMDTLEPSRIAPADDLDCDGAVGADDCDDLDPRQNNLDRDLDGISSCAGDCMDEPRLDVPWIDPADVHPGAVDIGENDQFACDHIDEDCDGKCGQASFDADGSGAWFCGGIESGGLVCDVLPADCDEQRTGNQAALTAFAEACNGRDDACDGFLPPNAPCVFGDGGTGCHWGQVACNEVEGEYAGENTTLLCKGLPEGFSEVLAPPAFCDAAVTASCFEAGDPVGCAFVNFLGARASCVVNSRGENCPADRTQLSFPGSPPATCVWTVVGGTAQAEWEIGFVPPDAPAEAVPLATIEGCNPELSVHARTTTPAQRSVLLLLRSADDAAYGARPMVVNLNHEALGECTGQLACQFAGAGGG